MDCTKHCGKTVLKCAGLATKAEGNGAEQKTENMKPVWLKLAQAVVAATAPLRLANGPGTGQHGRSAGASPSHHRGHTMAACIIDACMGCGNNDISSELL